MCVLFPPTLIAALQHTHSTWNIPTLWYIWHSILYYSIDIVWMLKIEIYLNFQLFLVLLLLLFAIFCACFALPVLAPNVGESLWRTYVRVRRHALTDDCSTKRANWVYDVYVCMCEWGAVRHLQKMRGSMILIMGLGELLFSD